MSYQELLSNSPAALAALISNTGNELEYIVNINGTVKTSGALFDAIAAEVTALPDYRQHEGIFVKYDAEVKCLFLVFVHSTVRGQSQGGTRLKYRDYEHIGGAIEDGLRLSKGMTDKNSISHLWWGGGKSIICPIDLTAFNEIDAHTRDGGKKIYTHTGLRKKLFSRYGRFVASLNGAYIAAEDMNTSPEDMQSILSECRFVTCLPAIVGGSSNPSRWTAEGVFNALRATLKHYEGAEDCSGKTVAVQGVGSVGGPLAEFILKHGGNVVIFDYDKDACKAIQEYENGAYRHRVTVVDTMDELFAADCAIFSPCAIGGVLTPENIARLKCKYVVGAANNQLKNFDEDYKLLRDKGIIYLPDFFVNRLGIINCANEQYGRLEDDLTNEVAKIYDGPVNGTLNLLATCAETGKTPQEVALQWATDWGRQPHPIWGHRGIQLISKAIGIA